MNEYEAQVLAELRAIRAHAHQPHMRYAWLKFWLNDLETNPRTQYKVHIAAAIFWAINLPVVLLMVAFLPTWWAAIGVLYIALVSQWANFATDWGAASACLAAIGVTPLPEVPTEPHVSAPH